MYMYLIYSTVVINNKCVSKYCACTYVHDKELFSGLETPSPSATKAADRRLD